MMVHVECEMLMRWSDKDVLQTFASIRLEFKRDIWAKGMVVGNIYIHIQNKETGRPKGIMVRSREPSTVKGPAEEQEPSEEV